MRWSTPVGLGPIKNPKGFTIEGSSIIIKKEKSKTKQEKFWIHAKN